MIQGVIERYEDDQLVVAISDLAAVRDALTDLPVDEQALAWVCEEPRGEIRRFVKPDR